MRYGMDYDRGYRGRAPETNWMGRNYRTPGEPRPRGYDVGAGYQPRYGARDVEWGGPRGYDRPYRPLGQRYASPYDPAYRGRAAYERGGYDRADYGPGYDRGYGAARGMERGRVLEDPWGPYSDFRQMQRRAGWVQDRPWPSHYFTDHGHHTGPY